MRGKPEEPARVLSHCLSFQFPPVRRWDPISYLLSLISILLEVYLHKDPEQSPVLRIAPPRHFMIEKTEPQVALGVSTSLSVCHRSPGSCHLQQVTRVGPAVWGQEPASRFALGWL